MPLLIVGAAVLSMVVGERALARLTMASPELAPKIGGVNARWVTGGVGAVMMMALGPIGMAIGAGLIGAAIANGQTVAEVQQGVAKLLGGPAGPSDVPGPPAVPPLGMPLNVFG